MSCLKKNRINLRLKIYHKGIFVNRETGSLSMGIKCVITSQ